MNEKQISILIAQQRKTNALLEELEEIIKELKKDNESQTDVANYSIPDLLETEKSKPFAHVVKNSYVYTFSYGKYLERKEATPQEMYMYRNVK